MKIYLVVDEEGTPVKAFTKELEAVAYAGQYDNYQPLFVQEMDAE